MAAESRLFQPLKLGRLTLSHRIAMAPLTRFRASDEHVPLPMVTEYYAQRASVPGTLLVTEGTFISLAQSGYNNVPGIYNDSQIAGWRKVTDAVHQRKSFIYCQLWALGRTANPKIAEENGQIITSSSAIALSSEHAVPEELTKKQIQQTIQDYAQAAKNAMEAGFDGVELHGANGYLIDQFLQDRVNRRTDEYGGSVENRSRFAFEVVKAVVDGIGADRVGIRFSPFSTFQGMRMDDPVSQFTDIITKLNSFGLAYVHLVESRIDGNADVERTEKIDFGVKASNSPVLVAGGFRSESAKRLINEEYPDKDVVVVFGRYFISTPDLPFRVKEGIALNDYDRKKFYNPKSVEGYTDYPFSREFLSSARL